MSLSPSDEALVRQSFALANRYVVEDIESECAAVKIEGKTWWDTTHMLSEHEHSNEVLDMAVQVISYAIAAGIVQRHPTRQHLVRILPSARLAFC